MKIGVLAVLSLGIMLLLLPGVLAAPTIGDIVQSILKALQDIFSPILSFFLGSFNSGELFVAKVIISIVLFVFVFSACRRITAFDDTPSMRVVVALAATLLMVRFVPEDQFSTYLLPTQGLLPAALFVFAPVVAVGFLLHTFGAPLHVRKYSIGLLLAMYFAYYAYSYDTFSPLVSSFYLIAFGLLILLFVFDGTIQRFLMTSQTARATATLRGPALLALQNELVQVHNTFAGLGDAYSGITPRGAGKTGRNAYTADIKDIQSRIKALMS